MSLLLSKVVVIEAYQKLCFIKKLLLLQYYKNNLAGRLKTWIVFIFLILP